MKIAAFSGGKDSTAMVLRLAEIGETFECLFTPAGNEPETFFAHAYGILGCLGKTPIMPENRPLEFWMHEFNALPSWRMRWCTRLIKIDPCIAYLKEHPGSTLLIGLRADEEERKGLYGEYAHYRYPLREWGWNESDVWGYLRFQKVTIPKRTNCEWCFGQQLGEWYELWRENPESYAKAEAWEARTGHTFRSPSRDTWPTPLIELRRLFEQGRVPRGATDQTELFGEGRTCRVCIL